MLSIFMERVKEYPWISEIRNCYDAFSSYIQMNYKSLLKLPNQLNLGSILPGQYGEIILPIRTATVSFLNLSLNKKAGSSGFFLLR